MNIIFKDNEHKEKYISICSRMKYLDEYHKSAAYLISLDEVCRKHISDIFDLEEDAIKLQGLHKDWQTGTSQKTTRLLFNLWNGYSGEDDPIENSRYTPESIFSCSYAPYYWQAIQIRFPNYTIA